MLTADQSQLNLVFKKNAVKFEKMLHLLCRENSANEHIDFEIYLYTRAMQYAVNGGAKLLYTTYIHIYTHPLCIQCLSNCIIAILVVIRRKNYELVVNRDLLQQMT